MSHEVSPLRTSTVVESSRQAHFQWIDVARGLGIILVVYGHVLRGLVAAGTIAQSNPLRRTDYIIYVFHMPLFFVLAGLNVDGSIARGKRRLFTNKLWTIAYPYLLWSAIQGSVQLTVPSYVNSPRSISFLCFLLWRPIGQFWFLYVLFICHMLGMLLSRRRPMLGCLAICSYGFSLVVSNPFWNPILFMFPFYAGGVLLGRYVHTSAFALAKTSLAVLLSGLSFAIAVYFGASTSSSNVVSIFSLPATVCGIALFFCTAQLIVEWPGRLGDILASIGVMSMTIYILHVLAAAAVRVAVKRLGYVPWGTQLSLEVFAGLALPMITQVLLARLNLLTALGLAPLSRKKTAFVPGP